MKHKPFQSQLCQELASIHLLAGRDMQRRLKIELMIHIIKSTTKEDSHASIIKIRNVLMIREIVPAHGG